MGFSVDPMDVLLPILRRNLPGVAVMSRVPDNLTEHVPLVVIRRTGGSSDSPTFYDVPWINVQCWAAPSETKDASRAAYDLADDVRRVLHTAWQHQQTTQAGWIRRVRESSAPEEITDPDVPHFGRFQATYEVWIRKNTVADPGDPQPWRWRGVS